MENKKKRRRAERLAKKEARLRAKIIGTPPLPAGAVLVNKNELARDNSYDAPEFAMRGYYLDQPFQCQSCGKEQTWTAFQQKWWYEVAKGGRWTTARLCRPCRRRERERREAARKTHVEGLLRKQMAKERK